MKKLLVLAVVAASFASCSNGEGDKKVEGTSADTSAAAAPMMSDTSHKDTATIAPMSVDTTTKKDTATKK